ncbi:MAG: DNA replication/repair protein RecF [Sphingomonadales bacterium]
MSIDRLSLTDFRSYADAVIAPGPSFVVLTGENGAGKTNVLEAISLLTPGRGLRGATMGEVARRDGPGGFGVGARLGDVELGTGTRPDAPERRIVRINGATATASALTDWLSLVWLTPAQDRLFGDSAGARRRFLDRLVLALHPEHARNSTRYEAAMRQRNRLLADNQHDESWLNALEAAMGEHSLAIRRARMETVKDIVRVQNATPSSFPHFRLSLDHVPDDLATRLAASRGAHAAAGRTLVGPHTSDLHVRYVDKDQPAAQSSTGEQKALLIGIVLAHADLVSERTGRRPILLLDEVAAHLDPTRRGALFDRLAQGGGQVWLTGTETGPFDAIGPSATWLTVAEGRVFNA